MRRYLTTDIPGTGGRIKETPEDFRVEEIPLYLPCGDGEHSYLVIEKRGLTTLEAVRRIARTVGVGERDVGYAGMKDAVGVTCQTLSIPRVAPEQLLGLQLPGIIMVSAQRHRNKLKLGHLAGNRFTIRVREPEEGALERAGAILDILARRGVPNYFGMQRFGSQGNSHLVGRAWFLGQYREAVEAIIGSDEAVRDEQWQRAIAAFRQGQLAESRALFPGHCRTEREIVASLVSRPENWKRALGTVPQRLKMLYFSALQSALFNRVLDERLGELDTVVAGDVAYKHDNGACFIVEDPAAEAERAQRLEISATGPLFGSRMKLPEGRPLEIEDRVLADEGLSREQFAAAGEWRFEGERRPLRIPLADCLAEQDGDGVQLRFSLPRGGYATAVLREVMKTAD
ncbi:MAG TPA: tRNA pseudouridine(13) synthase TruD, partial [Geobacteraceae bacterium]